MTGGQKSQATGRIKNICLGLGVNPDHLKVIIPLKRNHDGNIAVISNELNHPGLSVIIAQRECIQTAIRSRKAARAKENKTTE